MKPMRGEIWLADLDPTMGSEQAGFRPVLIFQNDVINRFTRTVLAIPLTTNMRRAELPSCVQVPKGEGGIANDSVLLCHQIRVLDVARLRSRLGAVKSDTMARAESCLMFTLGIFPS